jgi:hypothetical protein
MPSFSQKSVLHLETCHPDLQKLFREVIKITDCSIICGHRSRPEQEQAFFQKHSRKQWPHSKHNKIPSLAVDAVPYPLDWSDIESFKKLGAIVKQIAADMGLRLRWGGDFETFKDYPHYELIGNGKV